MSEQSPKKSQEIDGCDITEVGMVRIYEYIYKSL